MMRLYIFLAVFVTWSATAWLHGAKHVQRKWDRAAAKIEEQHLKDVIRLARAASELDAVWIQTATVVREKVKEVTKKVPVYVTSEADAKCDIPVGFIRLWDEPLREALATTVSPELSNDDSSGVALSRVSAEGVLEAKERFEMNRQALISCQSYVKEIRNAP